MTNVSCYNLLRSGDWRPALPRAGLHRPLGEPYSGPAPGTSPGNAGAKAERAEAETTDLRRPGSAGRTTP